MSERELNPHARDLRRYGLGPYQEMNTSRSEQSGLCPRPDTHLTYMIDIALTTEFAITTGGVR